ncbi:MAG: TetR/AcrR family transcriptional regulator [Myxococcota bacterium]|nr:TetR/AcrR family transcriptional regulator [Myxococcota bacterium]
MSKRAPRREPRRRTGRAIVDALLDAASSLLATQGLAGMTTNAVAERAGVSVGSLYQYFPNKQALVSAVSDRLNGALVVEVERLVGSDVAAETKLDALVALLCSSDVGDLAVRRALLRDVPRGWVESGIESSERRVVAALVPLARELAPTLADDEITRRVVLALFAIRGAAQGALLYEPSTLASPELRTRLRALALTVLS